MIYSTISFVITTAIAAAAFFYPSKQPYVTSKWSRDVERIWLWRIPMYADKQWYIRWSPSDGPLQARAYCYNPEAHAAYEAATATDREQDSKRQ